MYVYMGTPQNNPMTESIPLSTVRAHAASALLACMCICMYVCVYICICICICVYIYGNTTEHPDD